MLVAAIVGVRGSSISFGMAVEVVGVLDRLVEGLSFLRGGEEAAAGGLEWLLSKGRRVVVVVVVVVPASESTELSLGRLRALRDAAWVDEARAGGEAAGTGSGAARGATVGR